LNKFQTQNTHKKQRRIDLERSDYTEGLFGYLEFGFDGVGSTLSNHTITSVINHPRATLNKAALVISESPLLVL
jgi:hypothetical protein